MPMMIKVLAAKKETTYATDSVPTLAANAILTRNFSAKPVESDRLERNLDTGRWGANPSATTNERQTMSFEVELAGSGTAGTAAAWHELLEACGMLAPTITAGVRADQRFSLPTSAQSALSIYHWIADQQRRAVGARGTFGLDFTAGQYPFASFNFTGLIPATTPFNTLNPTGTSLTRWRQPLEVNPLNTTLTLDGFAAITRSVRLNANVQTNLRSLIGSRYVNRGPHAMTGQLVIEAPALATKDYIATLRTNALVAFSLIHGTAAGNIVELAAARMQINDITESEEDGIQMWTLDVACTVDAGSDDFTISSR